jgi:protein TonB
MFEDSTFESTGRIRTRSRRWMIATFVLNASVLVALILIPLIYPEALPGKLMTILLTAPPSPPQEVSRQQEVTRVTRRTSDTIGPQLTVPRQLPKGLGQETGSETILGDTQLLSMNDPIGIPDGNPFRSGAANPVKPVVRPEGPPHISSGVAAGLLIQKTLPVYPPIARASRTEGRVELQAIISKFGTIENLHVVSGSPMLQQAAIEAVKQWRYRPYMLNGEPVEVETTINVIFSLGR